MREYVLEYTNNIKEYLHAFNEVEKRKTWNVFDKIFGIIIILVSIYCIVNCSNYFRWIAIIFLLFGINDLLNIYRISYIIIRIHFFMNPKNKHKQKLIFSEKNILYNTNGIESKIEWSFYNRGIETNEAFLLFYGKNMYSVIPKRAVKTEEMEGLKILFADKIEDFHLVPASI